MRIFIDSFQNAKAACARSEYKTSLDTTAVETDGEVIRRRKIKKKSAVNHTKRPTLQLAPLPQSDTSSSSVCSAVSDINVPNCHAGGFLTVAKNRTPGVVEGK